MVAIFTPNLGEMIPFDQHIFSGGLVQPPTRCMFSGMYLWSESTPGFKNHHPREGFDGELRLTGGGKGAGGRPGEGL